MSLTDRSSSHQYSEQLEYLYKKLTVIDEVLEVPNITVITASPSATKTVGTRLGRWAIVEHCEDPLMCKP